VRHDGVKRRKLRKRRRRTSRPYEATSADRYRKEHVSRGGVSEVFSDASASTDSASRRIRAKVSSPQKEWIMGSSRHAVRRRRAGVACSLALLTALLATSSLPAAGATTVRVGVYNNPPKVEVSEDGAVSGLYPRLLEAIASEEGWTLEYVPGTWTESMARLDRGEVDVMVDVAVTAPRQELYVFNEETVFVNWGIVYTRPGLQVLSLPELEGLRVAVMRGSTHTVDPGGIVDLAERFGIHPVFIEVDDYEAVFAALAAGSADAGVVNRVFGLTFESDYGVERTPIVFNPIELRFAFPRGGPLTEFLVERIDARLVELKRDPSSAYYRALEENLLGIPRRETVVRWPAWLLPALFSAGVLIAGLGVAFLIVRREVRRRTEAEKAARENEERFELAMRGATDALWDWDLRTGKVYYSPRWAEMLGYAPDEIDPELGMFRKLLHADDRDRVLKAEDDYVSGRSDRYQAEFRMLHRSGGTVDILSRAFLVRNDDGTPVRLVGIHTDITARKRAERALREREAYIRTIIEHMPVDFFSVDHDLRYTMQSPISKQAIGDVIGQRADEIDVPEPLRGTWVDELRRAFAGEVIQEEYNITAQDGAGRTYLSRVAPVSSGGETFAVIGASMDITEQKQAAEALKRAKEAAEEADRLKSAFLATMSHELRTPLNSIIGFTGILLQRLAGPLTEEQAKQMQMVRTSARHLLDLINDVLDISKIEAGQLEVFLEPFDLPGLVQEAVGAARPLAEKKGIDLCVKVDPTIGEVRSDRRRVSQVLTNLLANAIKFTEKGGVLVECADGNADILIRVEDTGIGISKEDLAKLFVPFQQVDSGLTRAYEGTGLGLSICRRLVEKLGGTIGVESEPGRGSAFTVRLPKGM
jgi:PAS domain S-box-containing protein